MFLTVAKGGPRLTRAAPADQARTLGRPGETDRDEISRGWAGGPAIAERRSRLQDRTGIEGT